MALCQEPSVQERGKTPAVPQGQRSFQPVLNQEQGCLSGSYTPPFQQEGCSLPVFCQKARMEAMTLPPESFNAYFCFSRLLSFYFWFLVAFISSWIYPHAVSSYGFFSLFWGILCFVLPPLLVLKLWGIIQCGRGAWVNLTVSSVSLVVHLVFFVQWLENHQLDPLSLALLSLCHWLCPLPTVWSGCNSQFCHLSCQNGTHCFSSMTSVRYFVLFKYAYHEWPEKFPGCS